MIRTQTQTEIIVPGNLSKEQLDAEIQKGYDDMLEGRTEPAEQVFEEIEVIQKYTSES